MKLNTRQIISLQAVADNGRCPGRNARSLVRKGLITTPFTYWNTVHRLGKWAIDSDLTPKGRRVLADL